MLDKYEKKLQLEIKKLEAESKKRWYQNPDIILKFLIFIFSVISVGFLTSLYDIKNERLELRKDKLNIQIASINHTKDSIIQVVKNLNDIDDLLKDSVYKLSSKHDILITKLNQKESQIKSLIKELDQSNKKKNVQKLRKELIKIINPTKADAGPDQEICLNSNVVLTASGGGNYLWSTGETTASINVSPTETTIYTVTVSNGNSIDVDDVLVVVDQGCSGTGNRSVNKENKIYLNPTQGVLSVELTGYNNESSISIFDLNGRIVYSENIDNFSPIKIIKRQINLTKFGKGVYFVRIINNNTSETKKILVI